MCPRRKIDPDHGSPAPAHGARTRASRPGPRPPSDRRRRGRTSTRLQTPVAGGRGERISRRRGRRRVRIIAPARVAPRCRTCGSPPTASTSSVLTGESAAERDQSDEPIRCRIAGERRRGTDACSRPRRVVDARPGRRSRAEQSPARTRRDCPARGCRGSSRRWMASQAGPSSRYEWRPTFPALRRHRPARGPGEPPAARRWSSRSRLFVSVFQQRVQPGRGRASAGRSTAASMQVLAGGQGRSARCPSSAAGEGRAGAAPPESSATTASARRARPSSSPAHLRRHRGRRGRRTAGASNKRRPMPGHAGLRPGAVAGDHARRSTRRGALRSWRARGPQPLPLSG